MKKPTGFTLIEVMVVIAILGILSAAAIPLYSTWRQRTYGSEALVMLKRILEAEIIYYLENNKFFPEVGTKQVFNNDLPSKAEIGEIKDALKIPIPVGHKLDFTITTADDPAGPINIVTISSAGSSFDLFPGDTSITGTVDKTGKIDIL